MSTSRTTSSQSESEGQVLLQAGQALALQNYNARAEEIILKALNLLVKEGNSATEADGRFTLAGLYLRQERYQEAQEQLRRNLEYHQREEDHEEEAADYQFIYMAHMGRREYDQAEEALDNAIQIHRRSGSKLLEGNAEYSKGLISESRGDKEKALERYETALCLYEEGKDTSNVEVVKGAIKKLQGNS